MSQYSSYIGRSLVNRLTKAEMDLIGLKSKQIYNSGQMNFSFESNPVTVKSYLWQPTAHDHYGILASLVFTSQLKDIYPRVALSYDAGFLVSLRYEQKSENEARMVVQLVDQLVPMEDPVQFTTNFKVYSNTQGVLKLENTYVLPS